MDSNFVRGVLICQYSGTEADNHCHDHGEWWIIPAGEIHWGIEGREETVVAKVIDFVFVSALTFHHIHPAGGEPSIRLAATFPGKGNLNECPASCGFCWRRLREILHVDGDSEHWSSNFTGFNRI
ncbi:MAG: NUDIX hydrolase [Candidatus Latescibacterota bacterium]|nr:NUDIX hydrolase [Candidatus Latescibacterota bacterium]